MIYLIIFLYLLSLSFVYDLGNLNKGRNINFFIALLLLICLSGFRFKVGGDTYRYISVHSYIPNLSELFNSEIGINKLQPLWLLLSASAKSINEDFFVVQIIHALIVNTIIFYFIKTNTKYSFTGILLYYIGYYPLFNFEILRESLAISIFLLSIHFFNNNKWKTYYLMAVLALFFHYSAIILFILPALKKIPSNYITLSIIFVSGIILNNSFLNVVNSVNLADGFFSSMKSYGEYKYSIWGLISIALNYIIYPALLILICKSLLNIKSENYILLDIYLIIGACIPIFYIFFRFLNYFTPILFIFLTEIFHGFFKRKELKPIRISIAMIVLFIISIIHCSHYFSNPSPFVPSAKFYHRWYPYHSIFDKKTESIRDLLIKAEE